MEKKTLGDFNPLPSIKVFKLRKQQIEMQNPHRTPRDTGSLPSWAALYWRPWIHAYNYQPSLGILAHRN